MREMCFVFMYISNRPGLGLSLSVILQYSYISQTTADSLESQSQETDHLTEPSRPAGWIQKQQLWQTLALRGAWPTAAHEEGIEVERGGGGRGTEPPGTCLYSRLSPNVYFGPDWRPTGCN